MRLDEIDDLSISNNKDIQKVLATVAKTVIDFMQNHPNSIVMAKGSTPSRTRLYRIGIFQFWNQIEPFFVVKGFKENGWYSYEKGKNFEALSS